MAGEVLKKRREELGLDIKETAELLRIQAEYLRAIEDDNFDRLPVAVYTKGYIRNYAQYLDVDAEPIILFYESHLKYPKSTAVFPVASSRKRSHPAVFILLIFGGVAVAGILLFVMRGAEQPAVSVAPRPAPQAVIPSAPEPPVQVPSPAALPEQPVQKQPHNEHVLRVRAQETTWIRISSDESRREEVLLRSGDSKQWTFRSRAEVKIGNAGGIRIRFDDEPEMVPGAAGQVVTLVFPRE